MPHLLRQVRRLAHGRVSLRKPTERPERDGKPGPHVRTEDAGLTESLVRQSLRDQRDSGFAVPDGLAALAPRQAGEASIPVGDSLDADVRLRFADGQGATCMLERRREIAAVNQVDRLEVQCVTEAVLIARGLREGLGFVQNGPHATEIPKWHEGSAEVEAEVERLGRRAGMLRQP